MATRKKPPAAPQATFAFPSLTVKADPIVPAHTVVAVDEKKGIVAVERFEPPPPEAMHGYADQFGGEDAPHAPAIRSDAPITGSSLPLVVDQERKLRIVSLPDITPEEDVIVEPQPSGLYAVSLVRHHGSTVATVLYSRKQLEMLLARIPAALEVGQ